VDFWPEQGPAERTPVDSRDETGFAGQTTARRAQYGMVVKKVVAVNRSASAHAVVGSWSGCLEAPSRRLGDLTRT